MDDALYRSLLETVLDYVGKVNLLRARILPDRQLGSAFIEVTLKDETSQRLNHAIDRMEEVRSIFMDEVAIDYILLDPDTFHVESIEDPRLTYAAA